MDRENIIRISNDFAAGSVNIQDINEVIHDFCMEKDSSQEPLIMQCIQIILQQGVWQHYFETALNHFKVKFQICELYSRERDKGFDPFGRPIKGRDLLLVY